MEKLVKDYYQLLEQKIQFLYEKVTLLEAKLEAIAKSDAKQSVILFCLVSALLGIDVSSLFWGNFDRILKEPKRESSQYERLLDNANYS